MFVVFVVVVVFFFPLAFSISVSLFSFFSLHPYFYFIRVFNVHVPVISNTSSISTVL